MTKEKDEKIARKSGSKRNLVYITWYATCKLRDIDALRRERERKGREKMEKN